MRTFLHFLIVCVVAPAVGVAACSVFGVWDYGRFRPESVPIALFGGVIVLPFLWPALLPLSLVSYVVFRLLPQRGIWSWPLWLSFGAAFGIPFGALLERGEYRSTVLVVGGVVGAITAVALRFVWRREVIRAA